MGVSTESSKIYYGGYGEILQYDISADHLTKKNSNFCKYKFLEGEKIGCNKKY